MELTKQSLQEQAMKLERSKSELVAKLHMTEGALQAIVALIAQLDQPAPQPQENA